MRSDRIDDRVGEHLVSRDANRLDFHGIHEGDVLVDAGRFDPRRQRVGWERCCPSSPLTGNRCRSLSALHTAG
jgi:hypothetical protein